MCINSYLIMINTHTHTAERVTVNNPEQNKIKVWKSFRPISEPHRKQTLKDKNLLSEI